MKLAIISDVHYGIRNDHQSLLENNKKFFKDVFFPTIQKEGIKEIVCLGDLLDRRKYVNYYTASCLKRDVFDALYSNIGFRWILGNHDIFFRESLEVNAAKILAPFTAIHEARTLWFDYIPILFVPWICKENREQCLKAIEETEAQICFGHFHLQGFEQQPGVIGHTGDTVDMLQKFDVVLSGHYHQKQTKGNITYVGAHSEFIWSDYNQDRGFHIFDTNTRSLKFYENPFKVFQKVYYDDAKGYPTIPNGGFESVKSKIIKVIISGKNDPVQYDHFMGKIEEAGPLDITVVEDHLNTNLTDDERILSETQDTLGIIREYLKQANNIVNVNKLDQLVVNLYNEAQTSE